MKQNIKKALNTSKISFSDIRIASDGAVLVQLTDNGAVIFSKGKDIGQQVASLQFILNQLTMEGKRFSRLDLRFDKPIIVLK